MEKIKFEYNNTGKLPDQKHLRFRCPNKRNKEGKRGDLSHGDLYERGCINCRYVKTHRGESWTQDWARCEAPSKVKYGVVYKVLPARAERLVEEE